MEWIGVLSLGLLLAGQLAAQAGCSSVEDNLLSWLRANGGFVSGLIHSSSSPGCACSALDDFALPSASPSILHAGSPVLWKGHC